MNWKNEEWKSDEKKYTARELADLLDQAIELDVPLYDSTTISELEVLVRHEFKKLF